MAMSTAQRLIAREVGTKIRAARIHKGWTQEKLARAIDMSFTTVSKVETGVRIAEWATLEKIAAALDVGLFDLLPNFASLDATDQAHTRYIVQTLPGLPVPSDPPPRLRPNRRERVRVSPERRTAVKVPA